MIIGLGVVIERSGHCCDLCCDQIPQAIQQTDRVRHPRRPACTRLQFRLVQRATDTSLLSDAHTAEHLRPDHLPPETAAAGFGATI